MKLVIMSILYSLMILSLAMVIMAINMNNGDETTADLVCSLSDNSKSDDDSNLELLALLVPILNVIVTVVILVIACSSEARIWFIKIVEKRRK